MCLTRYYNDKKEVKSIFLVAVLKGGPQTDKNKMSVKLMRRNKLPIQSSFITSNFSKSSYTVYTELYLIQSLKEDQNSLKFS